MGESQPTLFQPEFNRSVHVEARRERLSADGGALLLRELLDRVGLVGWLTDRLSDPRDPARTTHGFEELLRTLLLLQGQGWSDQSDVERLREDPVFWLAASSRRGDRPLREPRTPSEPDGLASQPTLSRLLRTLSSERNRAALDAALLAMADRRHGLRWRGPVREATLDLDSLAVEVHGHQPGTAYNGHFRCRCYHPLLLHWSRGDFLAVRLRPGNAHTADGAMDFALPAIRWARQRVRRLFGWARVPVPSTFGRWLRRAGQPVAELLEELIRRIVRLRWERRGVPASLTLVLDATVILRYGSEQAGAECGYNPRKPGRPSHHPIVAFLVETGDLIGLRWRPGSAWTAEGAEEWLPELVGWLRAQGVEEITVRMDKGFHAKRIVRQLQALEVNYLLKVPAGAHVIEALGSWRASTRAEGIFEAAETVYTNSGRLWGDRLLALKGIRTVNPADEDGMDLETTEVVQSAHLLTNIPGIHSLTAWRAYNEGAVVEQRIEELKQLSAGQTAVDDLGGNHLLWALAGLTYQLFHTLRRQLPTPWRRAQPKRLRTRIFRVPARFTRHSRYWRLHLAEVEFRQGPLPRALEALADSGLRGPPARAG